MFLAFSSAHAQNTRWNNSQQYSKELKKVWRKTTALQPNTHKDKKEVGIVDGFRAVARLHPEEEGLCALYIADFYMRRSNNPNYDSAVYYYMKADGNIPEKMLFEQTVVYNNLLMYYVHLDSIGKAMVYADLTASIDSAQCGNMARLCLFGGPDYFNPMLAIDYCQAALRAGCREDLFPLIYAAQYVINTINDGTFDPVGFEYYCKAYSHLAWNATRDKGAEYLEKAAARNYFPAVVDLATYISSRKLYADKDQKEMCQRAITMLQPLVDANYPPAAHAAGMAMEYANLIMGGALVSADGFKKAYPYFEKGCNLGYPPSIAEVGRYHELNLGGLYGQHPEIAVQYYNAAENEGYYVAHNLKEAMFARAQLSQSVKELVHETASLVQQVRQTKAMFESREFAKKYNSSSVQNSQTGNVQTEQTGAGNQGHAETTPKKKIPSAMDMQNLHTYQRVYDSYARMLTSMWAGNDYYSDSKRRDYQSKMREICRKVDAMGFEQSYYRIYRSTQWENWDGTCNHYK